MLSGCAGKPAPVMADVADFEKLAVKPVDFYHMKVSPNGYLRLKAKLKDPDKEPTDILDFIPVVST